uniref:Uncharacterized protein n=1 Tax=Plectus sambesii TaxID=2011161 RepID=A0A914XDW7_9BILA
MYLTDYKGCASGTEGQLIRAMRTLKKILSSQSFTDKVIDFYIGRTGEMFG